jgi:hypothetical protein
MANPMPPNPSSIIAQAAGSGTLLMLIVTVSCADE